MLEATKFHSKDPLGGPKRGLPWPFSAQEHCILLCNYFNYIDRYRKERVGAGASFQRWFPLQNRV